MRLPSNPASKPSSSTSAADRNERYWKRNLRVMFVLLLLWTTVGFGAGILFVEPLNAFHLGGFPLGFWFAQQGSILGFLFITLAYAVIMTRLDATYEQESLADSEERVP